MLFLELVLLSGRGLCTGKHTLRFMDRKGEKPNHLAEINLVPNLYQGEIGPLLFIIMLFLIY
jgi:hypothetical protein